MKLVFAKLADLAGYLPMPDLGGRAFPREGFLVDADDPFWMVCLNDGSIREAKPPAEFAAEPAPDDNRKKDR